MKMRRVLLGLLVVAQLSSTGCFLFHKNRCNGGGLFSGCCNQRCAPAGMPACGGCNECGGMAHSSELYGAPVSGGTMFGAAPGRLEADETLKAPNKAWPGP